MLKLPTRELLGLPPRDWKWAPKRLVLISGLSNPQDCRLRCEQSAFLSRVACGVPWVDRNFPFVDLPSIVDASFSLPRASWNNLHQYFCFRSRDWLRRAWPHWQALRESCEELLIVTLSCGLELVTRMLIEERLVSSRDRELPHRIRSVPQVLALGPVASTQLEGSVECLKGRKDWVSRWYGPAATQWFNDLRHLDYFESDSVTESVRQWVSGRISESSGREVTCPNASLKPTKSIAFVE